MNCKKEAFNGYPETLEHLFYSMFFFSLIIFYISVNSLLLLSSFSYNSILFLISLLFKLVSFSSRSNLTSLSIWINLWFISSDFLSAYTNFSSNSFFSSSMSLLSLLPCFSLSLRSIFSFFNLVNSLLTYSIFVSNLSSNSSWTFFK